MSNLKWLHMANSNGVEGHYLQTVPGPGESAYRIQESENGKYWWLYVDGEPACKPLASLWAALVRAQAEVDETHLEACPGCGCLPGDGKTAGCKHPHGCGFEG